MEYHRRKQQKGVPATAGMLAIIGTPTTVLASAGTPTAAEMQETVRTPTNYEVPQKFSKKSSKW
jgi:hypothetical protein